MAQAFREILVTGATSPIGRAIATMLRRDNSEARITGLSRRSAGAPYDVSVQADLCGSPPKVPGEFDLVVHAAAAVPAAATADEFDRVNVAGSAALFRSVRLARDCAVLNLSTSSVYDDPSVSELDENSAKTTNSPYGKSKLEFERVLDSEILRPGLTILSVRIPVLLVPGVANNFVAGWVASIRAGGPLILFNPDGLLNAVVDDVAIYAFGSSYLRERRGGHLICNLAARDAIPIREAARVVMRAMGKTVAVIEKRAPKPAQTIKYDRARSFGYAAPSTADCLRAFVRRSLTMV